MNCVRADRFLHIALALPAWERDEICRRLGERSAVVRDARYWTRWFVPMFVTGTLSLLAAVFVTVYSGPFWIAAVLLPAGLLGVGVPAVKLWRVVWRALDIAAGQVASQDGVAHL